jgi:acetyl-CoA C-acetyltransferase
MAEGIKDKVAVIGMGCTKFGELWDKSAEDLMVDAFKECIEDAGIEKKDINAAWFGVHFEEQSVGKVAQKPSGVHAMAWLQGPMTLLWLWV